MRRGRATTRARRRALAVALALAVAGAAVAPVAPGPANVARAQGGTGIIAHSSKGVLLRAEPDFGAEVLATVAEGTAVGLRTDMSDTVYDPDGVTQWWPVRAGDDDGWVAGNTMLGNRTNQSLKETPISIDALTKEFLMDVGALFDGNKALRRLT